MQLLFDAVIFDLDGTLVATERFWIAAANKGAQRAFAELRLSRAMPSPAEWLSMVGLPLDRGFELVFADLTAAQRARVMELCVEEEHAALRAGGAAPMPGAFETLAELRARGIRLGIASNCSQSYLTSMLDDLGLRTFVDEARCLESRGIRTKTDMLADLLATFGTRSAVMVGDRAGDAHAAHANGLPHVHLKSGLAPRHESVQAEAQIGALLELAPRLGRRASWIEGALRAVGATDAQTFPPTLGITGRTASGKTLFARDAARVLADLGRAAAVVATDRFLRSPGDPSGALGGESDDPLRVFDLETLATAVLAPRARREATHAGPWGPAVPPGSVLLLEGPFLADPRVRGQLDRLVHLEVDDELLATRLEARERASPSTGPSRDRLRHLERAFEARFPPRAHADLVLAADNVLGG